MWQIKNPQLRPVKLDFSSSEQGTCPAHQLVEDGIELINAVELVDWDSEETQFLICDACGITHCKPGDWVSVRRADSIVLILPASDYVKDEYCPPSYLHERGIAYLDVSTYESLRAANSSITALDRIYPLSLKDATLLFHWDAPQTVLGQPPEIRIARDIVGGSSEGDHVEQLRRMEELMNVQYQDKTTAQLRAVAANERVITFYLDGAEFSEWKAMVFDGSEYRLLIDSKYVVARAKGE